MRLHQLLAVVKGEKPRLYGLLTQLSKEASKPSLFDGFVKRFHPKNDDDSLPEERKNVQLTVGQVLGEEARMTTKLLNLLAQVDWTNCEAKGDIIIDGVTILRNVPATFLLALEKRMVDTQTLIKNLPELDASEEWTYNVNSGLNVTAPTKVNRTKKVQEALVMLQPTVEHPGQAQLISKDVNAGVWETVKQSGGIGKPEKMDLMERVEKLLNAIKIAREEANATEVVHTPNAGEALFNFLDFRKATRSTPHE